MPPDFYRKNEGCILLYFTTADFAETAVGAANAMDIILINGRQIAEFLVYQGIGITGNINTVISREALETWADAFGPTRMLSDA